MPNFYNNQSGQKFTMWFKNILFYRFTKPFETTHDALENLLAENPFKPCGPQDTYQLGWTTPLPKSEQHVHVTGAYWMICLQKQERILPSSVVNEQVQLKVNEIEEQQHRKVTRKEKTELKEDIIQQLLPRSFTRTVKFYAYICPSKGYMVINTSSAKVADEFTSYLRKTIGSLPIRVPAVNQAPSSVMNLWLTQKQALPTGFELGLECELTSTGEDRGSIKYKGLELDTDQIENNISNGMEVTKQTINWNESISFLLGSDLTIKRIKFGDVMQDKLDDSGADDAAAKFDAGFAIMTLEFDRLIPEILEAFGGEDLSAVVEN